MRFTRCSCVCPSFCFVDSAKLPFSIRRIDEEEDESCARKLNYKATNKRPLEQNPPPTPSKNLFSPHLRSDSTDGRVGHGHPAIRVGHGIESCESVDTDLDVSEDSVNSPTEEIKQTSMIAEEEEEEEEKMDEDEVEEDTNAFNPYLFIAELPPHDLVMERNKICLPNKASVDGPLKTLVLDLDETLVHCTVAPIPDPDLIFPVLYVTDRRLLSTRGIFLIDDPVHVCCCRGRFNGTVHQVYVRKRPYLDHFLETIAKSFEVRSSGRNKPPSISDRVVSGCVCV